MISRKLREEKVSEGLFPELAAYRSHKAASTKVLVLSYQKERVVSKTQVPSKVLIVPHFPK